MHQRNRLIRLGKKIENINNKTKKEKFNVSDKTRRTIKKWKKAFNTMKTGKLTIDENDEDDDIDMPPLKLSKRQSTKIIENLKNQLKDNSHY